MSFTSERFLLFAAFTALLYWQVPARWRGWLLTVASYLFYFTWNAPMAAVLAAFTMVCYWGALAIERYASDQRKSRLAMGLTLGLVAYIVLFKVLPLVKPGGNIIIPLGISYYSFKLISYVLDVYWGSIQAERRLGRFAAFVAFFPQIVGGPIQRADSFFAQMENALPPTFQTIAFGASRILIGLFKKLFVADHLFVVINPAFQNPLAVDGPARLLAFLLCTVQLYADFSALTDIANGTALLLGMEGVENFNHPFFASSISDFWRRWHMSLTGWLRDYVFTPTRMSLRNLGNAGLALSITINMMAVALWHGFTWTFAVFGMIHSVFLCADALTGQYRKKLYKRSLGARRVSAVLGRVFTLAVVSFASTFFRARSVHDGWDIVANLTRGWNGGTLVSIRDLYLGLLGLIFIELIDQGRRVLWTERALDRAPDWTRWLAYSGVGLLYVFAILFIFDRATQSSAFAYAGF